MCAYSHDAALRYYSFLVRLHVPSKSPALHVEEAYRHYSIRYDRAEYPACMHTVSAIWLWPTVLVYNWQERCSPSPLLIAATATAGGRPWPRGRLNFGRIPAGAEPALRSLSLCL